MNIDWLTLMEKSLFGGLAALGFGILFNVPVRTLLHISLLGLLGIFLKNYLLSFDISIILSSFIGATAIGILSLLAAKSKHSPPLVFSIPAVIPMVPGIFTYKTMLGIIKLTGETGMDFNKVLSSTINNGLKATFIMMTLAVGVSAPNLIFRRESFHEITILSKNNHRKRKEKKRKQKKT